jgi:peroxiredoxin
MTAKEPVQAMRGPGDQVPDVTFRLRSEGRWQEKSSAELFRGRSVVVFAVPGAFASACSGRHLPGYVALARNIKRMGIDEIFCVAVNDAFVMNAWARDQGIEDEVTLLPDGNGDFARAMGMLVDQSRLGVGQRSWRYAMVVRDGVIQRIFAEDRRGGEDPFEVSDAITMLDYLDSSALRAAGE